MSYERSVRQTADFMEPGAPNTIGYVGLEPAIDMILNLGVADIFDHIQKISRCDRATDL